MRELILRHRDTIVAANITAPNYFSYAQFVHLGDQVVTFRLCNQIGTPIDGGVNHHWLIERIVACHEGPHRVPTLGVVEVSFLIDHPVLATESGSGFGGFVGVSVPI